MAQTAMQEAFERAGVDPALNTIDTELARLAQKHRGGELTQAFATLLHGRFNLLYALARFYIAQKMPGEGQSRSASSGHPALANARQPNGDGAGHTTSADRAGDKLPSPSPTNRERAGHIIGAKGHGHRVAAPAREQSAADRAAAARVAKVVSITLLDTFKLRGRVIGDITFGELESIAATNMREAALISRIRAYVANPDPEKPVRAYISATVLGGMLAGVNSHAA